jgi:aflatoxin B1 aldehyde reductase
MFQKYDHSEIDTSRFYGGGTSEEYLAALKWQDRKLVMDTKFYPNRLGLFNRPATNLTLPHMRTALNESLVALNADSVDLWYLHAPDRTVPLADTVEAVQELYKEGKFKRWGVSNYMAWEVAAICELCDAHGWVKPSVYQGVYNAFHRTIENELLPCLRKYGISFYAFNPLAGGYLTDRYHRETKEVEPGSRFDPNRLQGRMYRERFWNEPFFTALDILRLVTKKEGLRESESALRWMMHHSQLKKEFGDKVIIGASSVKQLEMNLKDFELDPLPEDVTEALDQGWEVCRGTVWKYFH